MEVCPALCKAGVNKDTVRQFLLLFAVLEICPSLLFLSLNAAHDFKAEGGDNGIYYCCRALLRLRSEQSHRAAPESGRDTNTCKEMKG